MLRMTFLCLGLVGIAAPAQAFEVADSLAARRAMAFESIISRDLKRHAFYLAEDSFEGREAGTRGGYAAGAYLVRELARHNLQPAGEGGTYFQTFGNGYRNLLAILPGTDERLKHEVVVVGAHYDHVGYGNSSNSYGPTGYIHNGADDNASGTSALLELVEAFQQFPTRRTILFALWDAEEKGLLGSKHWIEQPTLPLSRVKFAINMDMVGKLRDNKLEITGSRSSWGLRKLVARHNQQDLVVDFTWEIQENSDHYPFFARSIPILMPHTGLHNDYHRPSDDSEKLNPEGMQRVVRFTFGLVEDLANADELPGFRAAAKRETPELRKVVEAPQPPLPGRLGVGWDVERQTGEGLLLTRVMPGTAADHAGLREGDRLLQMNGEPLTDGDRLIRLVQLAEAETVFEVERQGQKLSLPVVLDGKPVRVGLSWRMDEAEPGVAIVTRLAAQSPATDAGLKQGDHIQLVNNKTFANSDEFQQLLLAADGECPVVFERAGKLHTVVLKLEPWNERPVSLPQSGTPDQL